MLKVAIIGPESTGKTTLAQQLAKQYNAIFVPEYAREYVEALNRPYTYDDVCAIARHQIAQMKQYTEDRSDKIVVYDTELIITRVWFDYLFYFGIQKAGKTMPSCWRRCCRRVYGG